MTIEMQPVESSRIAAIGHDTETGTLAIQFKGKTAQPIYHYANVPADVHQAMLNADSAGRFFAANIQGKYEFERQEAPNEGQSPTTTKE